MTAALNEHNMIGSFSGSVVEAAEQAGYEAAVAGKERKPSRFILLNGREVRLTQFTRTDWCRGYDKAVRDIEEMEKAVIEAEKRSQLESAEHEDPESDAMEAELEEFYNCKWSHKAELICDTSNEAFETYLDELVQETQSLVHVEQLTRQQAKQLLERAGFTGCGTMTIQEFGLPKVYTCYCDRGTAAKRVPLDQLIPTVKGWIAAEQSFQKYRQARMAQYA